MFQRAYKIFSFADTKCLIIRYLMSLNVIAYGTELMDKFLKILRANCIERGRGFKIVLSLSQKDSNFNSLHC